ncbi:IS6 family transposase [Nitrosomonas supralitoralis]|uniref:IS6 family transposase n=1 Tax=Nitrosomonas supralitoralis TaxID=2116706 RepID=UPI001559193F
MTSPILAVGRLFDHDRGGTFDAAVSRSGADTHTPIIVISRQISNQQSTGHAGCTDWATDRNQANTAAIEEYNTDNEACIELRQAKYLNNVVEQDHRAIKQINQSQTNAGIQIILGSGRHSRGTVLFAIQIRWPKEAYLLVYAKTLRQIISSIPVSLNQKNQNCFWFP